MLKVSSPLFQAQIVVKGRALQEYRDNAGRIFVEGRKGNNFSLELRNLTNRRILVHPSVDGLSVMTGELASRTDSEHGYVLEARQTLEVPGWRLNNNEVAKFFFAGEGKSYAEKKGVGKDKGVIACAVWEEAPTFTWRVDGPAMFHVPGGSGSGDAILRGVTYTTTNAPNVNMDASPNVEFNSSDNISFGSLDTVSCYASASTMTESASTMTETSDTPQAAIHAQNLGTGFGKRAEHRVHNVCFTAGTVEPISVAVIYYDDKVGLQARGIKITEKKQDCSLPNPFPKDRSCEPPPGWHD